MKAGKKAKMITLAATLVCLAAVGTGIYFFTGEEEPEVSETAPEPEASAENEEPENIADGLILISGGTFSMGSPSSERQRQEDEIQHDVTVSSFYIDPYEVTQSDYAAIMGENPSHFTGENLPVENVTWYDAVEYCNRLSESRGLTPAYTIDGNTVSWDRSANGCRLLTEAEWEYAARANTVTVFHDGDQLPATMQTLRAAIPI